MESQGARNQNNQKKKRKVGEFTLPDFKLYYKTIKYSQSAFTVWYWPRIDI